MPSVGAQASPNYTYTVIADATSCSTLGAPVLNNAGEVAFRGGCGPSTVVRRGDGSGPLTDIYTFTSGTGFLVPDSIISMNDDGAVAFWGSDGAFRHAILVGNGGPVSAVVDPAVHTQFRQVFHLVDEQRGRGRLHGFHHRDHRRYRRRRSGRRHHAPCRARTPVPTSVLSQATAAAINNNGVVRFIGKSGRRRGDLHPQRRAADEIALNSTTAFAGINELGRAAFVDFNSVSVRWGDGGPQMTVASSPRTGRLRQHHVHRQRASTRAVLQVLLGGVPQPASSSAGPFARPTR